MKKVILVLSFFLLLKVNVNAESILPDNIEPSTYIIGNHMFTRSGSSIYNGALTTEDIMFASQSIDSKNLDDMTVYYKNALGTWINGINGEDVETPTTFEISYTNLIKTTNDYNIPLDDFDNLQVEVYSSQFLRKDEEIDDTGKIQRAIDYIFKNQGGTLIIDEKLLINGTVNIIPTGHYPLEIRSADAGTMRYLIPLQSDYAHDEFKYTIERTTEGVMFNINYDGYDTIHKGNWSNFYIHDLHFKNGTRNSNNEFNVTSMIAFYQIKSSGTYENLSFYGFSRGIDQPRYYGNNQTNYCDFNNFINIYFDLLSDVGISVYNNDSGYFQNIISQNSYKTVKNVIRVIKSPAVTIDNVFFGLWDTYDYQVSTESEAAVVFSNFSEITISNIGTEHPLITPLYAIDSTIDCRLIRTKYQVNNFFKNYGSNLQIGNIRATAFERNSTYDYYVSESSLSRTKIDDWNIIDSNMNKIKMLHPKTSMPNQIYRETIVKISLNNGNVKITDIYDNDSSNLFIGTDYSGGKIINNEIVLANFSTNDTIRAVFTEKLYNNDLYEVQLSSLNNLSFVVLDNNKTKVDLQNINRLEFYVKIIY